MTVTRHPSLVLYLVTYPQRRLLWCQLMTLARRHPRPAPRQQHRQLSSPLLCPLTRWELRLPIRLFCRRRLHPRFQRQFQRHLQVNRRANLLEIQRLFRHGLPGSLPVSRLHPLVPRLSQRTWRNRQHQHRAQPPRILQRLPLLLCLPTTMVTRLPSHQTCPQSHRPRHQFMISTHRRYCRAHLLLRLGPP